MFIVGSSIGMMVTASGFSKSAIVSPIWKPSSSSSFRWGTEESPMASGGKGDALSRPSEKAKSVMDRLKSVYNVRC
jgi:hypothetical protein